MAEMSEFARMLKQKREEREKKFQDPTSDPGNFFKTLTGSPQMYFSLSTGPGLIGEKKAVT